MSAQEIQLTNGKMFEIVNNNIPTTDEIFKSVVEQLETSQNIKTLYYVNINRRYK
jgi:hypothetical protein